jgi:signal transduction histidine kinase
LAGHGNLAQRDRLAVTLELAQIAAAWPLGVSLAAAAAARGLHVGRRRMALNEALHELRRPLQALALAVPGGRAGEASATQGSLQMASAALERLEREINGETVTVVRSPLLARPLLDSAIGRWQGRAVLAGGSLALRWRAGEAIVHGDRCGLSQAFDNLIVNAIEHGGPDVLVEAEVRRGRLCLSVTDRGCESRADSRGRRPARLISRLSGRRLHGHGLRVVRRTAAAHGGDFRLRSSALGAEAVLELPLSGPVAA